MDFESSYRQLFQNFTGAMKYLNSKAILTEFGGNNTAHCKKSMDDMLLFMEENPDQFFGWAAWGANLPGSILYLDPTQANNTVLENLIVRDVIARHMASFAAMNSLTHLSIFYLFLIVALLSLLFL